MKRCPECRRDYFDDSLLYCLEDGAALIQGSVPSPHEPATAILHETDAPSEAATRAHIHTTEQRGVLSSGAEAEPQRSMGGPSERRDLSAYRAKPLLIALGLAVIVLGGLYGYRYVTQARQIESVAVMPFVNESRDADVEYLSDGMTESLIKSLSRLPNLNVKGFSTVFRYKGKETDTKTVGQELNVQAVLYGRVIPRGDQLTLSLELLDAETENVIWSDRYERKQGDLVTLQVEIVMCRANCDQSFPVRMRQR